MVALFCLSGESPCSQELLKLFATLARLATFNGSNVHIMRAQENREREV
jgi:hypothetical protein